MRPLARGLHRTYGMATTQITRGLRLAVRLAPFALVLYALVALAVSL